MKYFNVSTKICIDTPVLCIYKKMYLGKMIIFVDLPDIKQNPLPFLKFQIDNM